MKRGRREARRRRRHSHTRRCAPWYASLTALNCSAPAASLSGWQRCGAAIEQRRLRTAARRAGAAAHQRELQIRGADLRLGGLAVGRRGQARLSADDVVSHDKRTSYATPNAA